MASEVDASIPADNVKVSKADVRANFRAARDEITELQRKVGLPYKTAFGRDENEV
jgi:hypothetical protein